MANKGSGTVTGAVFERLTAVRFSRNVGRNGGKEMWLFKCICGEKREILLRSVVCGNTKSCGCLAVERSLPKTTKHGQSGSRLYNIWSGMKQRVFNKDCSSYPAYGGSGVTCCKRWLSFENFVADLGASHDRHLKTHGSINTTLDRIDPRLGYEPSNCRWATRKEQTKNRLMNLTFLEEPGICTVDYCKNPRWSPRARYCTTHRP